MMTIKELLEARAEGSAVIIEAWQNKQKAQHVYRANDAESAEFAAITLNMANEDFSEQLFEC